MKNYVLILLCYFLVFSYYLSANEGKQVLDFKSLPLHINIPTDVQQIYQDREGFYGLLHVMVYVGMTVTNLKL